MKKKHIDIPSDIASEVLFSSDRVCCVCQVPGLPVQIHHIDEDTSNNSIDNLVVLCLACHNDTQVRGGFDRKLSADVIRRYRIDWIKRVHKRRAEVDKLVIQAKSLSSKPSQYNLIIHKLAKNSNIPSGIGLYEYLWTLPALRTLAYKKGRKGWDTGITAEVMKSYYDVIDVLENALVTLASFYPKGHFDEENPRDYFSELISSRFRWHRYHYSTFGMGQSGTIVGPQAAGDVLKDVEEMIEDLAFSLTLNWEGSGEFDFNSWRKKWEDSI